MGQAVFVDYTALDDPVLMGLIRRSQADALEELYDRYAGLVFSVALRMVGEQTVAEDITIEVFTQVWTRAALYEANLSNVTTWLVSIARHRAIDALRRAEVRPRQVPLEPDGAARGIRPREPGPEESAELALRQDRIRAALQQLPDEQREVIELAYFAGKTQREIARDLDQPLGTVKTRLRLAMQKLRLLLQEEMPAHQQIG